MYDNRKSSLSWRSAVVIAGVGLTSLLVAEPVSASCAAPPEPQLLWSYPADGQEDVPIDTQLRMVFDAHLYDNGWKATLNGVPVTRDAEVFSFDRLEPNTSYTFRLEGHQPRSITEHQVEVHFRTGTESSGELSAPDVLGTAKLDKIEGMQTLCEQVDTLYHCRDTPPFDLRAVMLEADGAIGWMDPASNFWPASCAPWIDVYGKALGTCVKMRAVAANGTLSEYTEYCPADEPATMTRAQGQSAAVPASDCAVAAPGQRASGTSWLTWYALAVTTCFLRRKTRVAR